MALGERGHVAADLHDTTHELVAHDASGVETLLAAVIHVQVRTADRGPFNLDDHVAGLDDAGIVDGFEGQVPCGLERDGSHESPSPSEPMRSSSVPSIIGWTELSQTVPLKSKPERVT